MNYMRCGKNAAFGKKIEAIEMGFGVLVIRNIPCFKCDECDEVFYTADVAQKIEHIMEMVEQLMQEITVVDYSKVA